MSGQPARPARRAGRFRLGAHWSRTRRIVGGVLVDTGPLRRHRNFRRLWGGQLVSQVGSQLTIVAVSYQTYRLTGSTVMVGLVSLGQLIPLLAGSLLTGRVSRVHRPGRAVAAGAVVWGVTIAAFGLVPWLPAALVLLAAAGAADVVSAVFRMMIVQQATPDGMQGRVNSLIYAGIQGGPRLGDAEAGAAAAVGGPQFAAWSGGVLSVVTAVVTCWLLPGMWRYDSWARKRGPARRGAEGRPEPDRIG